VAECNKAGEAVFSVEVVHVPGAETSGGGGAWGMRRMIELWCTAGMGGRDVKTSRFLLITHDLSRFFPHHV
jgi:hypothetical protein